MDLGMAGFIVSVLGIIISLFIFVITTKYKRPVFFVEFDNIIRENALNNFNIMKLRLSYEDRDIQGLSKSMIFIWNKGRKAIRNSDLLIDKPLGVKFEKTDILEIKYAMTDALSKSLTLDMDNDEKILKLTFDCMAKNQGILLEILHTSSNKESIKIIGDIDDAVRLEDNKKIVRKRAIVGLIISVVWLFSVIIVAILSALGKIVGGSFGYGLGNGTGSGITYFISQVGSIGVMTILCFPGYLFIKFYEKLLNFLPKNILNLKHAKKLEFY